MLRSAAAVATFALLALAVEWDVVRGGTVASMDTAGAFYPWYAFLGERLRAGHIPLWDPHHFAGAPFAADPESGWMYLPAMLAFALLPLAAAATSYMVGHVLLAGLATYGLGRALGLDRVGALVAATAYAFSGFLFGHSLCCFAYAAVMSWLPVALLGAEQGLRSRGWRSCALWWAVAGLGVSQILGAWLGQGAYYALLVFGSYLAYRTLLDPSGRAGLGKEGSPPPPINVVLPRLLLHGGASLVIGFGLAAAGLLPRFEYNALSNLPGGYPPNPAAPPPPTLVDWGILDGWDQLLFSPGFYYVGGATLALAVAGVVLARGRFAAPYFAGLALVALVLARYQPTPLHAAFDLLPGFERVAARAPERAMLVFYLGPALLAGAAVTALRERRPQPALALLCLGLVFLDLHRAAQTQLAESMHVAGAYQLRKLDLAAYYAPSPALRFVQAQAELAPLRYVGYAPHVLGGTVPYTLDWAVPEITALGVDNRAGLFGLDEVQGYNPVHIARYDQYMLALNGGARQDYHHADVLPSGLGSPLLGLLNARYLLVPTTPAADQAPIVFPRPYPVVYQDDVVQVRENPAALPRAWVVHAARQTTPAEALALLAGGAIDPRQTALLEEPPPPLEPAAGPDDVQLLVYEPDRLELDATTSAAGLLVLSEAYYPAWHAYLDGQPAPVYVADHALRAVPLSAAGRHRVELRYESPAVTGGVAISLATVLLLALPLLVPFRWARRRCPPPDKRPLATPGTSRPRTAL
jgi:hypothetical protein